FSDVWDVNGIVPPATTVKWGKTDYAANDYIVPPADHCLPANSPGHNIKMVVSIAQITDGVSSTILAGEKSFSPKYGNMGSWYFDEPFLFGDIGGTSRGNPNMYTDLTVDADPNLLTGGFVLNGAAGEESTHGGNWGSPYSNVVPFGFA